MCKTVNEISKQINIINYNTIIIDNINVPNLNGNINYKYLMVSDILSNLNLKSDIVSKIISTPKMCVCRICYYNGIYTVAVIVLGDFFFTKYWMDTV